MENNNPLYIKNEDYETKKIIDYLIENNILQKNRICPKCGNVMKLEKKSQYIDGYIFYWRSKPQIYDIKENIRKNSIFEKIKIDINSKWSSWKLLTFKKYFG